MTTREVRQPKPREALGDWADFYRDKWKWDKVSWGSHSVDCYPGGCPLYVFVKDGKVIREEQAGVFTPIESGIPDMNPMGCQKGCSWSHTLTSPDRVTHPLKRVGERGQGKWQRVTWDDALTEIADAMLDAIQDQGPESILTTGTPEPGAAAARLFSTALNTPSTDGNAEFQDFSPGFYLTWGVFNPVSSMDDWFLAELTLIWHANPIYTNIHWYHYLAESRYNGGEVVTIAPDYSPSAIHADYHLPVRIGTDAALALSMAKVIIDAGLYNKKFVQEQTDLPLLVRKDTGRFLRGPDLIDGEREDQFYWADARSSEIVPAPRGILALANTEPALEGTFYVRLKDGEEIEVEPVFERLKEHLKDYEPEEASKICGVHPDAIRTIARKFATRRTKIFCGWNSGKYYHGDLIERSMALLLGLTGNWGKKGTGTRSWAISGYMGGLTAGGQRRRQPSQAPEASMISDQILRARQILTREDPTLTLEMLSYKLQEAQEQRIGATPPAFLWYNHYGYRERWNRKDYHDPSMKRTFDEYYREAVANGWWGRGLPEAWEQREPRVLIESGGNILRRDRGGQVLLLENLWPKLKMVVSIDYRINTTGMYSDFILPAAQHYEKMTVSMPSVHHLNTVLADRAVPPADDSRTDYDIGVMLVAKIEERAREREFMEYESFYGQKTNLQGILDRVASRRDETEDARMDSSLQSGAATGILPAGTDLATLREKGYVRWTGWPVGGHGLGQASTIRPDEVFNPFRWHTEDKLPYATLTRRAQFYIDHDWFMEAGEELPVHKETPRQGGDYPFQMTSGHNRWSIHSMNMTNNIMLNTHRGEPFVFINDADAAAKGIKNGEHVRMFNEMGYTVLQAKVSPSVRPGQLILYNGFEPYMHKEWYSQADLEPGMIKWLGFAGGYGHLRYRGWQWQPIPSDRAVRCDIEPYGIDGGRARRSRRNGKQS